MVDYRANRSQELLIFPTISGLVELCKSLVNPAFIWWFLKGCCNGNQLKSEIWHFFWKKLFVALLFQQINLLTPIDRATSFNAKSTISTAHQVQLPGNERRLIANCYRQRETSNITTYLNDNAQTPLGRFVVYTLYNELCSKYGDKSNWWSLCLSLSQLQHRPSKVRQIPRWSVVGIIDPRQRVVAKFFLGPQLCRQKWITCRRGAGQGGPGVRTPQPWPGRLVRFV